VRLLAPVLVFTAEEIWKHMPRRPGEPESVHMALFPKAEDLRTGLSEGRGADWNMLLTVRAEVLKALEQARNSKLIGGSLEASVVLGADGELATLLSRYAASLPALFIVSQVAVSKDGLAGAAPTALPGLSVKVERADGTKCERCWNFSARVGESSAHPTVCERCVAALEEISKGATAG
jgi:isoleucyl-tRNA synthetase